MPEHPTDAHFSFTFVFKQALKIKLINRYNIAKIQVLAPAKCFTC